MAGPTLKTVKHLFAASANRCSHPGCTQDMVTETGQVIGEICHITASKPNGPRHDPRLTPEERDAFPNLILFCPTHHKIVDDDVARYTPDLLRDLKQMAARNGFVELSQADAKKAERLHATYIELHVARGSHVKVETAQTINAQTVKLARKSKVAKIAHPDSVAANLEMSGYIKYLIARYQKYQHADEEKAGRGKYIAIYNAIRRDMGRSWEDVNQRDFPLLAGYLQERIRKSKLGRILNARGNRLFSIFEEWLKKPEQA